MKRGILVALLTLALVGTLSYTARLRAAPQQLSFFVVAHTGPGDPFWAVVNKGVNDAGKVLGVKAVFQGPASRDIPAQVNMARAAISARAAGIAISVSDPPAIGQVIRDARGKGIPLGAIPAIKMIREDKLAGKIAMASFDMDATTIQAIKEGLVEATVDQQQYLQGFISVVQLYLHAKYKLAPTDYNTGRGLVTKETAATVEALVKQGYR